MPPSFELAENVRHRFCAPVQLKWTDTAGQLAYAAGMSTDASVYGLGLILPVNIPVQTDVTVTIAEVPICGSANVRHSQAHGAEYVVGLHFRQALFMQKVPGLDKILIHSFYSSSKMKQSPKNSLLQQWKMLLGRLSLSK